MAHEDLLHDVQLMVSYVSSVICTRSNMTGISDANGQSHPNIVDVINKFSVLPNDRINNEM